MEMKGHTTLVLALSFVLLYTSQVSAKVCRNPCELNPHDRKTNQCIRVTIDGYANPESRRKDGSYCDGIPDTKRKDSECDTQFNICVSGTKEKCHLSGYEENKDVAVYNDKIGSTSNSFLYHLESSEKTILMNITAHEHDNHTISDVIENYSGSVPRYLLYRNGMALTYMKKYGTLTFYAVIERCENPCPH